MKIDIYVQRDYSALVVPSGCDLSKLPEKVRTMVLSPSNKKDGRILAQHPIALDNLEKVMAGLKENGYYINRYGDGEHQLLKQLEELDHRTHFINPARRVPDTEKVKKQTNEQMLKKGA